MARVVNPTSLFHTGVEGHFVDGRFVSEVDNGLHVFGIEADPASRLVVGVRGAKAVDECLRTGKFILRVRTLQQGDGA